MLLGCSKKTELASKPSFWQDFQSSLESKKLARLTSMMTDSVYCSICDEESLHYSADQMVDIFSKQLFEPDHTDFTLFVDSSAYTTTSIYHLIFEIDCGSCPEGAYNVIYDFTEEKESIKLTQIFTVP